MREHLMPYFEERILPIEMIVLHCSAYAVADCIGFWHEYKVAPHYLIDEDGEVIKMVDEEQKAFHAGKGFWDGRGGDMNEGSIGIELINKSMGQEFDSYTTPQIDSLISLCGNLIKKYKINPHNVLGHSDIAPCRKADPGRAFPWDKLADEGIGLWYNESAVYDYNAINLLQKIGYDVSDVEVQIASAYAFRRHYLPQEIKAIANFQELLDNPYPKGDKSWLEGKDFLQVLNAVACNKK